MIASEFKTCELGEVALLYDSLHQTPKYADDGYPMIRVTDIRRGSVDTTNAVRVDEETYLQFSKKYKPTVGDVLFSRVGSYGNSAYVSRNAEFCLGQNTVCISPERSQIEPTFLYCALNSDGLRHQIESFVGGASQGTISLKNIRKLRVPLPPLPVQRRIAGILSAYDELIENSQRRIKILEAMTRALYREWFVHFRFPGYENHPRIVSPLGEIPQGWEVKTLAELCSRMESGGTPKRSVADYWEGGEIDWYKTGELWDGFLFDSQEQITDRGQRESTARLFEPGTLLMAIYGSPTVGRMGILTRHASCNQAALGLVANKSFISQTYLYFVLFSLRDHLNGLAQGAAQQNISKEKVANTLAIMPMRGILESFDRNAEPVFVQLQTLQRQIQNLRRTRDLLLPRLLSGQFKLEAN